MNGAKQAVAPKTQKIGQEAFSQLGHTEIRWLGNAGALVNSRGTVLLVDPLLKGFDMPLLIDMPIEPGEIPRADAVLLTHCDNDHFSRITCQELSGVCRVYHSTQYVASLAEELGLSAEGHGIRESFSVGDVRVTLTPADHAWQNESPEFKTREFKMEDCCGFWLDTPDGAIWAVGDSRLLEEQLKMPEPDVMLFDISDSAWHIGFENAVRMADTYPHATIIPWHWGSVDAPDWKEFNGDPEELKKRVVNPERVRILAPGERFVMER